MLWGSSGARSLSISSDICSSVEPASSFVFSVCSEWPTAVRIGCRGTFEEAYAGLFFGKEVRGR